MRIGEPIPPQADSKRRAHILGWLCLSCLLATSPVRLLGDESLIESFAGPQPSWRLAEEDCGVVVGAQQRIQVDNGANSTFESIQFTAGNGTRAYWRHDIEPVLVIPELIPSIWLRSDRADLTLHALVVLPHAMAPDGKNPIQFLVDGPAYRDVGRWQKLTFAHARANIAELVKAKAVLYRSSLGTDVNEQDAYVAALVVNAYGGPRSTTFQIDDLALEGAIPYEPPQQDFDTPSSLQGGTRQSPFRLISQQESDQSVSIDLLQTTRSTPAPVTNQTVVSHHNGQIEVNGVPFFARVVRHQGESLYDLRELGFNVVLLDHPPTAALAEEAAAGGLWLICPPHVDQKSNGVAMYRRVLAWNLGRGLVLNDFEKTRQRAITISNRSDLPKRPHYAEIHQGIEYFGQVVDVIEIGRPVAGTSFVAKDYFEWLRRRINQAPERVTIWAAVTTQYPPSLLAQAAFLSASADTPIVTPSELESVAIESLAAGCRGLVFQNDSRLDELDRATNRRARTLQWINEELAPLEPWIAAGTVLGSERTSTGDIVADTISTNRADLILVRRWESNTRIENGYPDPITIYLDRSSLVSSVYQMTHHGANPLRHDRDSSSIRFRLDRVYANAKVVVTQDPLALGHLHRYDTQESNAHLSLYADCLADWQASVSRVMERLHNEAVRLPESERRAQQANASIAEARRHLLSADGLAAEAILQDAQWQLDVASHKLMTTIGSPFPNQAASPLLQAIEWLPAHVRLAGELGRLRWGSNTLPAGDFNNLEHVQQSGWTNHRGNDDRFTSQVELLDRLDNPHDRVLRMRVEPTAPLERQVLLESTPLWVVSPPIHLDQGDVIRVHGKVRFQAIDPNQEGTLLIIDSIGGMALAEHVSSDSDWREFTLYRAATEATPLRITMALTGPGEARFDDLEVRVTRLPYSSMGR